MITVKKQVFFSRGSRGRRRMWQVLKPSRMEEPVV